MKKVILILFTLLSTISFSQNSWINIHLQTDNYSWETSWELLNGTGTVIATNEALSELTLYDTIINLNRVF